MRGLKFLLLGKFLNFHLSAPMNTDFTELYLKCFQSAVITCVRMRKGMENLFRICHKDFSIARQGARRKSP